MQIGYSEQTLWRAINKQWESIEDEVNWMNHYIATGEAECVEDCARNIQDSVNAILENLENLKGESL